MQGSTDGTCLIGTLAISDGRSTRRLRSVWLVAIAAAAAAFQIGLLMPGAAHAASSLVFSSADFTTLGLRPASASAGSAGRQLGAGLPADVRALLHQAPIEASAASGRGRSLRSDAFPLGSASAAQRVLTSWRQAHRADRVRIGAGGSGFVRTERGHTTAQVLWRDGARLGLIVLTESGSVSRARSAALADALLADSFLKTRLPSTAWAKVLDQIRPNGTVSEPTALQALALAYGPLPGVHPPSGRVGQIASGTLAAQWALAYRSKLKGALLRAVDRNLGVPPPGVGTPAPGSARAHAADLYDPSFVPDPAVQAVAEGWAKAEGSRLGRPLGLTILAGVTNTVVKDKHGNLALADALPLNASDAYGSGTATTCRIRVPPAGQKQDSVFFSLIIAHEVFHCFQFDILGARVWTPLPPWIGEGTADWAALTVDPVDYSVGGGNLTTYIQNPATPLFTRSYDAVGFWGHVQDTVGNLWARLPSIILAGGNQAAFNNAAGDSTPVLNSWGSSPFNRSAGGLPWQMLSPIVPTAGALGEVINPAIVGGGGEVEAAPYTTAQYVVEPSAPVLHVALIGSARLSTQHNYTDLGDAWFCTIRSGACVCPPGTTGQIPATRPLTLPARLGLTGDPDTGTHGVLTAYPLSAFCRPKDQPGTGNGTASTGGDPHLFDFEQGFFDFQAAGEFTLVKSTQDDLQIQTRQQPFPGSRSVAVNTAIAMRVGSATVEVDSAGPRTIAVYVNRSRVHGRSVNLGGGGHLGLEGPSADVTWRDGTHVQVFNAVTSPNAFQWAPALDLEVKLARHRLGHVEGVMGNWGVPASAEFGDRRGHHYAQTAILADVPRVVYGKFGASWRITQRESLFRYAPGKSTRSYTIAGFPSKTLTAATLPPRELGAGQTACKAAGITNTKLFADCEVDVGATGKAGFAAGDHHLQTATGIPATPALKLHPIDLGVGENDPEMTYDRGSGDTYVVWLDNGASSVDVCVVTPTAPSCNGGAGPYHLVDPLASAGGAGPVYFYPRVVVQPGGTVVVLAEVDGASSSVEPPGYADIGVVAWSSIAGGAGFASAGQGLADGGGLLASGAGTGDPPSTGAVALDATDIAVYGDAYPFGNGITDFTLSAPAPASTPAVDATSDYGNEVTGSQLASLPDPSAPGEYVVVAVGADLGAPTGCPAGTGVATGYGVAVGTPEALQTQSAWSSRYFAPISCQASSPVLAGGGPTGQTIGLLEDQGPGLTGAGSDGVYYRRFDTTTDSFGAPVLVSGETTQTLSGAENLDVSQDGATGVYASWSDGRGVVLSYSATGGTSWPTPLPIPLPISPDNDLVTAGVAGGSVQVAYTANSGAGEHEYLVPLSYAALSAG